MMRRSPALRVLVLGTLLFVALRWRADVPLPSDASDDELLLERAFALRVHRSDRAVRDRLARIARFDGEDQRDADTLEAEARRLGLDRSDVVARRHMVQMMELAGGRLEAEDVPTEAELRAWLEANAEELSTPEQVRFTHVFVARDRANAAGVAERLLDELRRGRTSPDEAGSRGDAFLGGTDVGPLPSSEVRRRFGPGFAESLATSSVGTWTGPIRSSWGFHLVFVRERVASRVPALEHVRGRVTHRVLRERRDERLRERMAGLRSARAGAQH